jgi:WD40 repeat protein
VVSAVFRREGLAILTRGEYGLQLREAATGREIGKPFADCGHPGYFLTLSPDASRLVLRFRYGSRLVDLVTGKEIKPIPELPGRIYAAAFSADGSRVLFGFQRGVAQLRDATTFRLIGELRRHQDLVLGVAFSPDGSRLFTGSFDGTTRLWDATALEPVGHPVKHQSEVKDLAVSPDGARILIGYADGTVRIWDATELRPEGTPIQYVNIVSSVTFSADGSRLLACSLDKTARLWDTTTLKPIGPPLKHTCRWPKGAFSFDGDQILLVDRDGEIQMWDAPPGPLEGDLRQISCWVEVVTGLQLDAETGDILVLDGPSWRKRRKQLTAVGGQPAVSSLPPPLPVL